MAEPLLPCPFCGATKAYPAESAAGWYIECGTAGCGTMGPDRDTETEAEVAWNTRASAPADEAARKNLGANL